MRIPMKMKLKRYILKLSPQEKWKAMERLIFLVEKQDGEIKASQRSDIAKDETASLRHLHRS
jgi:hypothetical protein